MELLFLGTKVLGYESFSYQNILHSKMISLRC